MNASRRPPAPLPRRVRSMLADYRDAEDIPADVEDRIWSVVGAEDAPAPAYEPPLAAGPERRRGLLWIGVGLAAAAVLFVAWRMGGDLAERRHATASPDAAVMRAEAESSEGRARAGRSTKTMHGTPGARPSAGIVPPEEAAPKVAEPTLESGAEAREAAPVRSEVTGRVRRRAPESVPSQGSEVPGPESSEGSPTSTLAVERELVARAWRALAHGDVAGALAAAAEHARRFEEGLLVPEREAVETIARCRREDEDAATRAEAFHRAHPRSPLAGRVDDACQRVSQQN